MNPAQARAAVPQTAQIRVALLTVFVTAALGGAFAAGIEPANSPQALQPRAAEPALLTVTSAQPRNVEGDDSDPALAFARDVTLHVVLHELGHALIREFDIPVLGNEETAADAFATHYLATYLPDRAVDVLTARTISLMIEAGDSPEVDWTGEHDHDARRAYQIAALAVAADPVKYKTVAAVVAMSDEDIREARDYGAEIDRSWRRVIRPLLMPDGVASGEARVLHDASNALIDRLCADGLADEIESVAKRFDWHSQVTVRLIEGDGGAGWNRSSRTITVHSAYVRRFVDQYANPPTQ